LYTVAISEDPLYSIAISEDPLDNIIFGDPLKNAHNHFLLQTYLVQRVFATQKIVSQTRPRATNVLLTPSHLLKAPGLTMCYARGE
jgi:hypothetical protein